MNSWLAAFVVKLSIVLVFAFVSLTWLTFCVKALEVTVVGAPELSVVGVGLLLIKLSTKADVTLGAKVVENVLASGGTIGINGIGWGCMGWDTFVTVTGAVNRAAAVGAVCGSSNGCDGFYKISKSIWELQENFRLTTYSSRRSDSNWNSMQVSEANSSSKASFSSPLWVRRDHNFPTRIFVTIVNVKLQRLSFVRFNQREKIFTFVQNWIGADDIVTKWP